MTKRGKKTGSATGPWIGFVRLVKEATSGIGLWRSDGGVNFRQYSPPARDGWSHGQFESLESRLLMSNTCLVTTTADDGPGSLREAIIAADASSSPAVIDFNIAGSGVQKITLQSALPAITDSVTLDGTTQSGYSGQPLIWLDGSLFTGDVNGLTVDAANTTIRGLAITGFGNACIELDGGNDTVQGNYLGVGLDGQVPAQNYDYGVVIASSGNLLGGPNASDGNVISNNQVSGILVQAGANSILGNFIGVDPTGTMAAPNGADGITVMGAPAAAPVNVTIQGNVISANYGNGIYMAGNFAAGDISDNLIGVDTTGELALGNQGDGIWILGQGSLGAGGVSIQDNTISGNYGDGIRLDGAAGVVVTGNQIGTDAAGTTGVDATGSQLGNYGNGVDILGASQNNLIGGPGAGDGNLISGNNADGVWVRAGQASFGNVVQGNYIGTDVSGMVAIANQGNGVAFESSGNSVLDNLISGNMGNGIRIGLPGAPADSNIVQGNDIGTQAGGTGALPNQTDGVNIDGSQNLVGGTGAGQANTIWYNIGNGVTVDSGTENAIRQNSIYLNASGVPAVPGIGIDLGYNGVTLNDSLGHTGPNLYQNFPVLLGAVSDGSVVFVQGTLEAAPSPSFTVELFANTVADPSGYGQGETFVGSIIVTTDATGLASFEVQLNGVPAGEGLLTSTATDSAGNTSEFSAPIPIIPAATISGFVYDDSSDNNGIKEPGQPGIAGASVTLSGANDLGAIAPVTVVTAADGSYSFGMLLPGTYTISLAQPAGYLPGLEAEDGVVIPNSMATNPIGPIAVTPGQTIPDNDFAELLPSTLSGYVYNDSADNEGIKEPGEPGIAGVSVTLTGANDLGAIAPVTAVTAADGSYSFGNLRPGTYTLTETPPAGYLNGLDSVGTEGGTVGTDMLSNLTVKAGVIGVNNDFAELLPSTLSGYVYNDSSYNEGIKEPGEPGIAGVTLTLTGANDLGAIAPVTAVTAADGSYSFGNLRPGTYTITETPPTGYLDGKDSVGTEGGMVGDDVLRNLTVKAAVTGANNDFAELVPSTLSGFVYNDSSDNNGIKEPGEPGIGGVSVALSGANDLGAIAPVTVVTAADGSYSFGNLRPGTYTITETPPAGYLDGKDSVGTQGGTVGDDVLSNITVKAGVTGANNDFAELKNIIAGVTYRDMTGNGLTGDDTPMPGVTVSLYLDRDGNATLDSGDGAPVATVVSTSAGYYQFLNVTPGVYFDNETVPTGYVRTYPLLSNYYTVNLTNTPGGTSYNFANYMQIPGTVTNVSYTIDNTKTVTTLGGQTNQGDTVTVTFTVTGTTPTTVTLVSYNAPSPTFSSSNASQQTIYQEATGTFGPGVHTLTVTIPQNYYQIDFIEGAAIGQFGPAGSNIFYSAQGRLISSDNSGTHSDVVDESGSTLFWANQGQSLIRSFNVTSTTPAPTALGNWLAANFANLYGASGPNNLAGKSDSYIAAFFMQLYDNPARAADAQVLAAALNIYASTSSLGGQAGAGYGFDVTDAGLGSADFDVLNNGAAFGVANNTTLTLWQLLQATNSLSKNDVLYNGTSSLLSMACNTYSTANNAGTLV